jgi:hypothetical protein
VNDAFLMRRGKSSGNLDAVPDGFAEGNRAAFELVA